MQLIQILLSRKVNYSKIVEPASFNVLQMYFCEGDHQTIQFDKVVTNVGNMYNPIDGIFRAPVDGTYVFCWTNTNRDHSYMNTELIQNGKVC